MSALAVRIGDAPWEGATEDVPVEGLHVWIEETGERARWHADPGLYGLHNAATGPHTLRVEDPHGAFLPMRVPVELGPTQSTRALRACTASGRAIPAGQTVLWGEVRDHRGQIRPFTLLCLEGAGRRWVGGSDATGRYVLWLRGLPWRDESAARPSWPATLRIAAPPLGERSPPLYGDLDQIAAGNPDPTRYPTQEPRALTLVFGAKERLDLEL